MIDPIVNSMTAAMPALSAISDMPGARNHEYHCAD